MSAAGWYPDPAGAPDTYRYWDGQAWSDTTMPWPPRAVAPEPQATEAPADGPEPSAPPADDAAGDGAEGAEQDDLELTRPLAAADQPLVPPSPYAPTPGAPTPTTPMPTQPPTYGAVPPPPPGPPSAPPSAPPVWNQPAQQPWGQQGWGQYPGQPGQQSQSGIGPRTSGKGLIGALVVGAVLLAVLLAAGAVVAVRGFVDATDSTDTSSAGPAPRPDGPVSPDDGDGGTGPGGPGLPTTPVGGICASGSPAPLSPPTADDTITGGGLAVPVPSGYTVDPGLSVPLFFADAVTAAFAQIDDTWISEYAVGGLPRSAGFTDPEAAAKAVMECLTQNPLVYDGFSGRKDLSSEPITVGGKKGHRLTSEVRVSSPGVSVEGDVTTVIVVDTGDADTLGFYLGVVPIGDQARLAQAEAQIKALRLQ